MRRFGNAIQNYYGTLTITTAAGVPVTATGVSGSSVFVGNSIGSSPVFQANGVAATALSMIAMLQAGQTSWQIYQPASSSDIRFNAGGTDRLLISGPGNVSIPAPTSGNALQATGVAANLAAQFVGPNTAGNSFGVRIQAGTNASDYPFLISNAAGTINYFQVDGTGGVLTTNGGAIALSPIYAGIPQNNQGASYTLVLSDANKHVQGSGASTTLTIPSNASVAYPIGTGVTFVNGGASPVTIAINTDQLRWSPSGATGSRTLAVDGIATAIKTAATVWRLTGTGIT